MERGIRAIDDLGGGSKDVSELQSRVDIQVTLLHTPAILARS